MQITCVEAVRTCSPQDFKDTVAGIMDETIISPEMIGEVFRTAQARIGEENWNAGNRRCIEILGKVRHVDFEAQCRKIVELVSTFG